MAICSVISKDTVLYYKGGEISCIIMSFDTSTGIISKDKIKKIKMTKYQNRVLCNYNHCLSPTKLIILLSVC